MLSGCIKLALRLLGTSLEQPLAKGHALVIASSGTMLKVPVLLVISRLFLDASKVQIKPSPKRA